MFCFRGVQFGLDIFQHSTSESRNPNNWASILLWQQLGRTENCHCLIICLSAGLVSYDIGKFCWYVRPETNHKHAAACVGCKFCPLSYLVELDLSWVAADGQMCVRVLLFCFSGDLDIFEHGQGIADKEQKPQQLDESFTAWKTCCWDRSTENYHCLIRDDRLRWRCW